MNFNAVRRVFSPSKMRQLGRLVFLTGFAILGLVGCGGGNDGNDQASNEPAPKTMNGIVFRLFAGGTGPVFTFIRSGGDAVTGSETGNVSMAPNPGTIAVTDSSGNSFTYTISPTITAATYTYTRTAPEGGRIVITGRGQDPSLFNYFGGNFSRTYEMIFATDGTNVTTVATVDYDTAAGITVSNITYNNGSLTLFGGGLVPVGWNLQQSAGLDLPKIFPEALSGETLELTLIPPFAINQRFVLLESTFTRFTDAPGDFLEKGIGNLFLGDDPNPETINYEYQPSPSTNNVATVRIFRAAPADSRVDYEFTFITNQTGTVTVAGAPAGTFEFPFLGN